MKDKKNRFKVEILLSIILVIAILMSIITSCTPKPTGSDISGTMETNKDTESNEDTEPKTKMITDSAGRKVEIPT